MNRIDEATRNRVFRREPMTLEFLSIMLRDLQLHEDEDALQEGREARDAGTIYDCPDSTFRAVLRYCERFRAAFHNRPRLAATLSLNEEQAGSDLYLTMAGHGADFRDRDCWHDSRGINRLIGVLFANTAQRVCGRYLETYLGDDGEAYIFGEESA